LYSGVNNELKGMVISAGFIEPGQKEVDIVLFSIIKQNNDNEKIVIWKHTM
jgi:hypothetical protein